MRARVLTASSVSRRALISGRCASGRGVLTADGLEGAGRLLAPKPMGVVLNGVSRWINGMTPAANSSLISRSGRAGAALDTLRSMAASEGVLGAARAGGW